MSAFTAAVAFKNALYAQAVTLWASDPTVQVSYGHPGQSQADDMVAFMDWSGTQQPVTLGPRRQREEELRVTVMFSIYRGGGTEQEKICTDRLIDLLGDLEEYTRVTDTTLGGVVRHCFIESFESAGSTDPAVLSAGRLIEASAVFVAVNRVTS